MGILIFGFGYFISLYFLIRVNYFSSTKKRGLIQLILISFLCAAQGSCNYIAANFIERDRTLEQLNFHVLVYFIVLIVLGSYKIAKQAELKINFWPLRLVITLLSTFFVIFSLAYFFS